MMEQLEHFKCLSCNYGWFDEAGPVNCAVCDHSYVKWITYNPDKFTTKTKKIPLKRKKR